MATQYESDLKKALDEAVGATIGSGGGGLSRTQISAPGYEARQFFQQNGGNGAPAPEMNSVEYALRNLPGGTSGALGVGGPPLLPSNRLTASMDNPLEFKAGGANIPANIPGATGGLADGMANPLAFDPTGMQGTTLALPANPSSNTSPGPALQNAAAQAGQVYKNMIEPGLADLTGGGDKLNQSMEDYGLIGGALHTTGRTIGNMGRMLGGLGGSALDTLFGVDTGYTASNVSDTLRKERLGVEPGAAGPTVEAAAAQGLPTTAANPDAQNAAANPDAQNAAATPKGFSKYTTPEQLAQDKDSLANLSTETRKNAWDYAGAQGFIDPKKQYSKEERDEILLKAADHKRAGLAKLRESKERIGLRAEARSLISDRALDASSAAAARGDRLGGAEAARQIRGLQQTVGPAIEKYGADALKALKNPKSITDPERRTEVLGALGLGPDGVSPQTAEQGVMAQLDQMTSKGRPTGGGQDAGQLQWDAAQSAKGVLRQGMAVGVDVNNSPAAKQYFTALGNLGTGTGKVDKAALAPLKQAFEAEIASAFQAKISRADYAKTTTAIQKVQMGMDVDRARAAYYATRGTAAGLTPKQAMDSLDSYIEENGADALNKLVNTVQDQKSLEALSKSDQLVYGSYLLARQGLGINNNTKKTK